MKIYSIAIDGPAGAGKSTIAKMVAEKLNFIYVDTGAMYRAFGVYCLENSISSDDQAKIDAVIDQIDITIEYENQEQQVILNNRNITSLLRSNEASQMSSAISVHSSVRLKMVELQRKLATKANVVMDGRDIGTFVLPQASLKIYLTANVEVRAVRRFDELIKKGITANIDHIRKEIIERDERDMTRAFAPLKKAEDAVEIDTSDMTISEVTNEIIRLFESKEV